MIPSDVLSENRISLASADVLEIVRLLRLLLGKENTVSELIREIHRSQENQKLCGTEKLMAAARQIYSRRRAREVNFPKTLFGEPGWDMLLALYSTAEDRDHTVSGLSSFAGTSPTTALRYISVLLDEGFIERMAHPTDGRVSWVSLTNKGRAAIEGYLMAVLEPHRR